MVDRVRQILTRLEGHCRDPHLLEHLIDENRLEANAQRLLRQLRMQRTDPEVSGRYESSVQHIQREMESLRLSHRTGLEGILRLLSGEGSGTLTCHAGEGTPLDGVYRVQFRSETETEILLSFTASNRMRIQRSDLPDAVAEGRYWRQYLTEYVANRYDDLASYFRAELPLDQVELECRVRRPLTCIERILCPTERTKEALLRRIIQRFGAATPLITLIHVENPSIRETPPLPLHVIAVTQRAEERKDDRVLAVIHQAGELFLFTDERELLPIGRYRDWITTLVALVDRERYMWVDLQATPRSTLRRRGRGALIHNGRRVKPFTPLRHGAGAISVTSLLTFNQFLRDQNNEQAEMVEALQLSLTDGYFLSHVKSIIKDDRITVLTDLHGQIIIRAKIEGEAFLETYIKEASGQPNVEFFFTVNQFFRILFNLEVNRFVNLA